MTFECSNTNIYINRLTNMIPYHNNLIFKWHFTRFSPTMVYMKKIRLSVLMTFTYTWAEKHIDVPETLWGDIATIKKTWLNFDSLKSKKTQCNWVHCVYIQPQHKYTHFAVCVQENPIVTDSKQPEWIMFSNAFDGDGGGDGFGCWVWVLGWVWVRMRVWCVVGCWFGVGVDGGVNVGAVLGCGCGSEPVSNITGKISGRMSQLETFVCDGVAMGVGVGANWCSEYLRSWGAYCYKRKKISTLGNCFVQWAI